MAARGCLCTRLQQTHVPAEGQQPRYPGRVHGLGTRGRNRAHHPRVCVSCSPWAILSRLTIFLAVINRWGLLHACTCATHICNTHALDFMGTHFCRVTHPLGDNRGCIELSCPTFSDRTGCQCGQLAELLKVSREKPCMRGQGISGAHGPHLLRGRTFASHLRAKGPRMFLTTPVLVCPRWLLLWPTGEARAVQKTRHQF